MIISMIVCMARNRVIGRAGSMPWRMPSDLKHFRSLTLGKTVVMGRKTFGSIGKPLPGRRNVVVSRQAGLAIAGADVAASLEAALTAARARGDGELVIIGGGELYAQAMPLADHLHVTELATNLEGDTYFPPIEPAVWRLATRAPLATGGGDDHAAEVLTYVRRGVDKTP
jgi:dihydrofolate reductase